MDKSETVQEYIDREEKYRKNQRLRITAKAGSVVVGVIGVMLLAEYYHW